MLQRTINTVTNSNATLQRFDMYIGSSLSDTTLDNLFYQKYDWRILDIFIQRLFIRIIDAVLLHLLAVLFSSLHRLCITIIFTNCLHDIIFHGKQWFYLCIRRNTNIIDGI